MLIQSINPSADLFVLGDLKLHHRDLLIYCGKIDSLDGFCSNFDNTKRPYSDC